MSSADHGRILHLDGWRGLAILTVLAGHFVPGAEALGGLGVDIFLVLSGRLMAQILVDEKFPLPTFFLRRFSRIYPALLVFATTMLLASLAVRATGRTFNSLITPLDYFAALTMWMNYKVVYFGEAGAVDHLWSISVEEHSYLILATLVALFARRRAVGVLVLAISAAALLNGYLLEHAPGASGRALWRTDVRIAPLFLAFALYLSPVTFRRALGPLSPALLLLTFVVPFSSLTDSVQLVINSIALACAAIGLDGSPAVFRRLFEGRTIRFVGVTSYSLYLWQQPLFTLHERVNPAFLLPIVFVLALASYNYVEKPARQQLNAWIARVTDARRKLPPQQVSGAAEA